MATHAVDQVSHATATTTPTSAQEHVTRGQIPQIASNSAGFNDPPHNVQQYEDVQRLNLLRHRRLTNRGLVNGYPCGGVGEPCGRRQSALLPTRNARNLSPEGEKKG